MLDNNTGDCRGCSRSG